MTKKTKKKSLKSKQINYSYSRAFFKRLMAFLYSLFSDSSFTAASQISSEFGFA
jgi:hypothetical protein